MPRAFALRVCTIYRLRKLNFSRCTAHDCIPRPLSTVRCRRIIFIVLLIQRLLEKRFKKNTHTHIYTNPEYDYVRVTTNDEVRAIGMERLFKAVIKSHRLRIVVGKPRPERAKVRFNYAARNESSRFPADLFTLTGLLRVVRKGP